MGKLRPMQYTPKSKDMIFCYPERKTTKAESTREREYTVCEALAPGPSCPAQLSRGARGSRADCVGREASWSRPAGVPGFAPETVTQHAGVHGAGWECPIHNLRAGRRPGAPRCGHRPAARSRESPALQVPGQQHPNAPRPGLRGRGRPPREAASSRGRFWVQLQRRPLRGAGGLGGAGPK